LVVKGLVVLVAVFSFLLWFFGDAVFGHQQNTFFNGPVHLGCNTCRILRVGVLKHWQYARVIVLVGGNYQGFALFETLVSVEEDVVMSRQVVVGTRHGGVFLGGACTGQP
jgi:hypothetical protein